MPVKSYLAFSRKDKFQDMLEKIDELSFIEAFPAENREVAVVVLETEDENAEKLCRERLEAIPEIQCLALVFGHSGISV